MICTPSEVIIISFSWDRPMDMGPREGHPGCTSLGAGRATMGADIWGPVAPETCEEKCKQLNCGVLWGAVGRWSHEHEHLCSVWDDDDARQPT